MLILDCTGSMGAWIKEAKDEINNIIDNVRKMKEGLSVRVSIVCYRDFSD
jgi:uncharacterized protein YegL